MSGRFLPKWVTDQMAEQAERSAASIRRWHPDPHAADELDEVARDLRAAGRRLLPCPRTWPHAPHGPWRDGLARHVADPDAAGFDCPGVVVRREEQG